MKNLKFVFGKFFLLFFIFNLFSNQSFANKLQIDDNEYVNPRGLLISEFSPKEKWIELYNSSDNEISLLNYKIRIDLDFDNPSVNEKFDITFLDDDIILPKGYFLISFDKNANENLFDKKKIYDFYQNEEPIKGIIILYKYDENDQNDKLYNGYLDNFNTNYFDRRFDVDTNYSYRDHLVYGDYEYVGDYIFNKFKQKKEYPQKTGIPIPSDMTGKSITRKKNITTTNNIENFEVTNTPTPRRKLNLKINEIKYGDKMLIDDKYCGGGDPNYPDIKWTEEGSWYENADGHVILLRNLETDEINWLLYFDKEMIHKMSDYYYLKTGRLTDSMYNDVFFTEKIEYNLCPNLGETNNYELLLYPVNYSYEELKQLDIFGKNATEVIKLILAEDYKDKGAFTIARFPFSLENYEDVQNFELKEIKISEQTDNNFLKIDFENLSDENFNDGTNFKIIFPENFLAENILNVSEIEIFEKKISGNQIIFNKKETIPDEEIVDNILDFSISEILADEKIQIRIPLKNIDNLPESGFYDFEVKFANEKTINFSDFLNTNLNSKILVGFSFDAIKNENWPDQPSENSHGFFQATELDPDVEKYGFSQKFQDEFQKYYFNKNNILDTNKKKLSFNNLHYLNQDINLDLRLNIKKYKNIKIFYQAGKNKKDDFLSYIDLKANNILLSKPRSVQRKFSGDELETKTKNFLYENLENYNDYYYKDILELKFIFGKYFYEKGKNEDHLNSDYGTEYIDIFLDNLYIIGEEIDVDLEIKDVTSSVRGSKHDIDITENSKLQGYNEKQLYNFFSFEIKNFSPNPVYLNEIDFEYFIDFREDYLSGHNNKGNEDQRMKFFVHSHWPLNVFDVESEDYYEILNENVETEKRLIQDYNGYFNKNNDYLKGDKQNNQGAYEVYNNPLSQKKDCDKQDDKKFCNIIKGNSSKTFYLYLTNKAKDDEIGEGEDSLMLRERIKKFKFNILDLKFLDEDGNSLSNINILKYGTTKDFLSENNFLEGKNYIRTESISDYETKKINIPGNLKKGADVTHLFLPEEFKDNSNYKFSFDANLSRFFSFDDSTKKLSFIEKLPETIDSNEPTKNVSGQIYFDSLDNGLPKKIIFETTLQAPEKLEDLLEELQDTEIHNYLFKSSEESEVKFISKTNLLNYDENSGDVEDLIKYIEKIPGFKILDDEEEIIIKTQKNLFLRGRNRFSTIIKPEIFDEDNESEKTRKQKTSIFFPNGINVLENIYVKPDIKELSNGYRLNVDVYSAKDDFSDNEEIDHDFEEGDYAQVIIPADKFLNKSLSEIKIKSYNKDGELLHEDDPNAINRQIIEDTGQLYFDVNHFSSYEIVVEGNNVIETHTFSPGWHLFSLPGKFFNE